MSLLNRMTVRLAESMSIGPGTVDPQGEEKRGAIRQKAGSFSLQLETGQRG